MTKKEIADSNFFIALRDAIFVSELKFAVLIGHA